MPKGVVEGAGLASVPVAVDVCGNCGAAVPAGALSSHECPPAAGLASQATTGVLGSITMLMAPLGYGLGTKDEIQRELDGIAAAVRTFPMKQPDQVMRECAAYCARLTELEVLLHRVEASDRQYVKIRTMQVDRWLQQLEFQWKVASRLVEVQRQDLSLHLNRDV